MQSAGIVKKRDYGFNSKDYITPPAHSGGFLYRNFPYFIRFVIARRMRGNPVDVCKINWIAAVVSLPRNDNGSHVLGKTSCGGVGENMPPYPCQRKRENPMRTD